MKMEARNLTFKKSGGLDIDAGEVPVGFVEQVRHIRANSSCMSKIVIFAAETSPGATNWWTIID